MHTIWLPSCIRLFINFLRWSRAAYWKLWNNLCPTEMLGMLRKGQLSSHPLFFMLKKHHPRVEYKHTLMPDVCTVGNLRTVNPFKELVDFNAVLIISSSCLPLQSAPFTLPHQSVIAADRACRCLECIVFNVLKVKILL